MLPPELITKVIKNMEPHDINMFCKTNKYINKVCKENNRYILKQHIKKVDIFEDPESYINFKILFDSDEEMYNIIGKSKLLDILAEEYPINQNYKFIEQFGEHVFKNWREYIKVSPEITILYVAHLSKSLSESDLKYIVKYVPKKLKDQILEFEKDWFNTTNKTGDTIYKYIKKTS
jgi:hypothetical protein